MTAVDVSEAGTPPSLSGEVAVIVASLGRPDELRRICQRLESQTQPPDRVILAVVAETDLPPRDAWPEGTEAIISAKGLPHQRNAGLDRVLPSNGIVVFFDDDYVPSRHALANIHAFFAANPDVTGVTGRMLADGIRTCGITEADADAMVDAADAVPRRQPWTRHRLEGLYGCNMAFRADAIGQTRFDERLPLYAWLEDIDFSVTVSRRGPVVKSDCFWGVHRGVKGGRQSGYRLGYSQVANPLYLIRKGTVSARFGLRLLVRNVLANHARSLRPEPWVDRAGRVRGNWRAVRDMISGRLAPERVLEFG